jgi:hypothetical protein
VPRSIDPQKAHLFITSKNMQHVLFLCLTRCIIWCTRELMTRESSSRAPALSTNPDGNKTAGQAQSNLNGNTSDERTVWMTPLESRFSKAEPNLNRSRRQLLRQILDTCQDTYFLSSHELAKRFQVDTATIVRTIQVLGYERYGDFLADLRSHFVRRNYTLFLDEIRNPGGRRLGWFVSATMPMLPKVREEICSRK